MTIHELADIIYEGINTRSRTATMSSCLSWFKRHGYATNKNTIWTILPDAPDFIENVKYKNHNKATDVYKSSVLQKSILAIFTKDSFKGIAVHDLTCIIYETDKPHHSQHRSISGCLAFLSRKNVVYNLDRKWNKTDYAQTYYDFIVKYK